MAIATKTDVPVETLVQRILETGLQAVNHGDPADDAPKGTSWLDFGAPIRGLFTDDELDTLFARSRSLSRSIDLA